MLRVESVKASNAKWWIVGLLFAATLLNYLDRQTLAVSASRVLEDLGLHDGHFGRWLFAFFIAYGVAQIVVGPLLDRFSVVWGVSWLRSLELITAVICVATFGLGCFMVNYLAFASEVSATKVSTATGILGGAGSLSGAAFMWLVGDTVMRSGGFGFAFALAGVMPVVALGGLYYATRARPTPRPLPPDAGVEAVA